jgi:hypothetical protein
MTHVIEVRLICLSILFLLSIYEMRLQSYLWLLDVRYHEGVLEAKQYETVASIQRYFMQGTIHLFIWETVRLCTDLQ